MPQTGKKGQADFIDVSSDLDLWPLLTKNEDNLLLVIVHLCANFGNNRSNSSRDMAENVYFLGFLVTLTFDLWPWVTKI